ncbi:MAG: SMI1/KNR4 family protein [Thainema sp.]
MLRLLELENLLSIQFPEDVKASYHVHNGQSTYRYGLINGREFLSLERIRNEWQVWKELLDSGEFQIHDPTQESNPDPGIRHVWWSDKWIPLTHDGAGNHDCLDLNPADGGKVGQIITMWHDDDERKLIAPSFRDWLKQ